jgi:hypothetical protein
MHCANNGFQLKEVNKWAKKARVCIPFPTPLPCDEACYKFKYSAPQNVSVVGSFPLELLIKENSNLAVNVAVEMPSVSARGLFDMMMSQFFPGYVSRERFLELSLLLQACLLPQCVSGHYHKENQVRSRV